MLKYLPLSRLASPVLWGMLLLTSAACKKDKDSDPQPATATNRFGYAYAGTTHNLTGGSVGAIWTASSKTLYVTGTLAGQQLVIINIENVTGPGTYPLTRNTNTISSYGAFSLLGSGGTPTATWQSQRGPASPAPGSIVITKFDEANQIAEGTFSFTAGPSAGLPGTATGTATVSSGSFGVYQFF